MSKKRNLLLSRTTLRNLNGAELGNAAGGSIAPPVIAPSLIGVRTAYTNDCSFGCTTTTFVKISL